MIVADMPRRGTNVTEKVALVGLVAIVFFALELLAGTSAAFAGLIALYVILVAVAVTVGGGVGTIPSVIVLFFAFQHVFFSQIVKFALGQRPDERLFVPIPTMIAENVAVLGIIVGLAIVRHLRPWGSKPIFPPVRDLRRLRQIAIMGALLALGRQAIVIFSGSATSDVTGTALGPIKQLVTIDTVAFAAAVAVAVIESGGRRVTNAIVWALALPAIATSFLSGGRTAIVYPLIAVAITALSFGFRFRLRHGLFLAVSAYVFFFIVSPFGLVLRSQTRGLSRALDAGT